MSTDSRRKPAGGRRSARAFATSLSSDPHSSNFKFTMNRRQFIATIASGVVAAPALADTGSTTGLPQRTLGRTGIRVPILGFGGGSRFLMYQDEDRAIEALHRALNLGIVYLDTAHAYGDGKS